MNLNPTEINIRASWALNCAVALFAAREIQPDERELFENAKMFLGLLDQVKAVIQPPMKSNIVGKSTQEHKDIAREEASNDAATEN